jgi:hypothetical protein
VEPGVEAVGVAEAATSASCTASWARSSSRTISRATRRRRSIAPAASSEKAS